MKAAIIVHGGAGWVELSREEAEERLEVIRESIRAGLRALRSGGSSLDAVEAAVRVMEDSPLFNAGLGSSLNYMGEVEMDASIMDGSTLKAGAVACVRRVKNPVSLARLVMERTPHVLLAGEWADKLAKEAGLELADLKTERAVRKWRKAMEKAREYGFTWALRIRELLEEYPGLAGTVGAVAVDSQGRVAAATSTGGLILRMPGRIGDTPLIGCGTYADLAGGCSATGVGEAAIRVCLAKSVVDLMSRGLSPKSAASAALEYMKKRTGLDCGVVCLSSLGELAAVHTTPYMLWGRGDVEAGVAEASLAGVRLEVPSEEKREH
ncbi:MAG: hypothetical protein DRN99_06765 [Thermoproteota archaeon]|nr:MAG: hypothetical protein DRN99_06765 [Candidatus Korarchaeota archaeon]